MSGRRSKPGKVNILGAKPEAPKFLQQIREQLVAREDAERKDRADRKRKERQSRREPTDSDDDPTIVKLEEGDITEAEYKRMKHDLETQYKLDDSDDRVRSKPVDLDVDAMIANRQHSIKKSAPSDEQQQQSPSGSRVYDKSSGGDGGSSANSKKPTSVAKRGGSGNKMLSYDSSSDDDDE